MKISVIVPCRNERRHIERFMDEVCRQTIPGVDLELLIADGRSTDGTREILVRRSNADSRIVMVDNPELTTSHALNHAIDRATGDVIVRMDVHTEYASDYVLRCLETLQRTGADNVGGPARTRAKGYFQVANSIAYHSLFSVGGALFHDAEYEGEVDTVVYGCWRREVFDRIGRFDPELIRNQDDEFNLRLIRAGGRVWQNPAIRSWYYPRARLVDLFRQYRQYGYWKVRVIGKHRVPASVRHLIPGAFVLVLGVSAVLAPFWRPAAWLLAGVAGSYLVANLVVSVAVCRRRQLWRYIPVMPLVFSAYHFGYGFGFVQGIVDFIMRPSVAREAFKGLTR
jgi:glycosyltransferase involved in cell wall biosynthesis